MASITDISALSSTYLNQYSDMTSSSASGVEDTASKDFTQASDEELMNACKEFETYLVEQLFKSMRATVPKDESMGNSTYSMFEDTLYQEYASMATDTGQFGIAQALYEQMKISQEDIIPSEES